MSKRHTETSGKIDSAPGEGDSISLLADLEALEEHRQLERRALRNLLDKKASHIIGHNSMMGTSRSFVTSVTLSWAAENIRFASELPIFNEFKDKKTGMVIADKKTQHLIQQRNPDWRRQLPMTLYLAVRSNHKFPAMLVVVTQSWVDDNAPDYWDAQGRAQRDSLSYDPLDSSGRLAHLLLDDSTAYAIDGQHRLMAIRGLKELIDKGRLAAKRKIGTEISGRAATIDDLVRESGGRLGRGHLHALLDERIGIEIVPAVMRGETRREALRRLRSIFVHVNRTAKRLSKGELALLDEDDGFAVVARMTMVSHPLLVGRVEIPQGQLGETSSDLTTLETLTMISKEYLLARYKHWEASPLTGMTMRPEEDELDVGQSELKAFFDDLETVPSFHAVRQGASSAEYRALTSRDGQAHLLFRPMAQMALAGAISDLVDNGSMPRAECWEKVRTADREGRFTIDDVTLPWYGVVLEPGSMKMRRQKSAQLLARRLLVHLIGMGTPNKEAREDLREKFARSRQTSVELDLATDLRGEVVPLDQVDLPKPW